MREEKDSLGTVEVPSDALYGAQTQRAIDNFPISGIPLPASFIQALAHIKSACAHANAELGLLDHDVAAEIERAADSIAAGEHADQFPVDVFQTGSGTSTNMNMNEVIARLASTQLEKDVHPNDHVNKGQSSNDVIPTAIHLSALLALTKQLMPSLQQLINSVSTKADTLKNELKTGRTHLMDAMPMTFGQELGGWAYQLGDSQQRLQESVNRLQVLAIGGTAIGTGVNTHNSFARHVVSVLNERLSLTMHVADNHFALISGQETALEVSSHLRTLANTLFKISNDLRWMNSGPYAGIGEIALPALQPGSSIMPGKVNPVIPEAVAMVSAQVTGNDTTIAMAAQSGNFQLNVMLPVIAYNLLQSISLVANSCQAIGGTTLKDFTLNHDTIDHALSRNPILVTALNNEIGYELSAKIAKQAYEQKLSVKEVAKSMTDLSDQTLDKLLDPRNMI
ncbi:class II fumarate hydratase [Alteromonas oceanisediminis]|uniref:class II fumarate hydratase n=1 Tax=Alteromonas oceanisediminis TaxID=2836180 RepID=UPI001BD9A30C|nr:class II fumarate hydratase [Alteromonas oceanisediminis]MBT0586607.1 class II fumarate hydratase [Alteromonas oceanisediminis]